MRAGHVGTIQHGTTEHKCDVARRKTARRGTARHDTTRHDTTRHNTTQHNTTRHDTTQHDIIWYHSQCPHQIDTAVVRVAAAENERKSERIAFGFIVPFARTLSTPSVPSRRQQQQQRSRLIHRQRVGLRVEYPLVQRQHRRIVTKQQIKILQRLACAATHAVRNRAQDARRTQTLGTMTSQVPTEGLPFASWRAGVGSTT
jgi:hypothetical protein